MNNEISFSVLGYSDMFSPNCGLENLTVVKIRDKNLNRDKILAIEAPCHILWSMYGTKAPVLDDFFSRIDGVLITHGDTDHIGGFETLVWRKYYKENRKLLLVTHPEIVKEQIWPRMKPTFGISRDDMKTKRKFKDYVDLVGLKLGRTVDVPQLGIGVKTFRRSTFHAPFLSIAFQLLRDNSPILAYSGDTCFDPELIRFLARGGNHPIIHEVGAYQPGSRIHTHIKELLTLPLEIQKRLYINHVPRIAEFDILREIRDAESPIKTADMLNSKPRKEE